MGKNNKTESLEDISARLKAVLETTVDGSRANNEADLIESVLSTLNEKVDSIVSERTENLSRVVIEGELRESLKKEQELGLHIVKRYVELMGVKYVLKANMDMARLSRFFLRLRNRSFILSQS